MNGRWVVVGVAVSLTACASAPVWRAVSPDRAVHVAVQKQRSRSCVQIGSAAPRCHDAVSLPGVTLSSRGGSVAYPARMGDRWVVIHDGRAGPEWDGVGTPVLTSDGARVAYPAVGASGWTVVVDDKPGATFDAIIASTLGFDASGAHVGYVARRGDSSFVVIDRAESRAWSVASRPAFFADGAHSAYVGWLDGRAHAVLDGVSASGHDSIVGPVYSRAQSVWAYAARDSGVWNVITGASREGPFNDVRDLGWPPGRNDTLPAYIARRGAAEAVVLDGVIQRWHTHVSSLAFAFDGAGSAWGYVADTGDVYIDGTVVANERAAADLTFSEDGSSFAYVASGDGSMAIVSDGKRSSFDLIVPGTLVFLPGGRAWACLAGDQRHREVFVVVDGRRTTHRIEWAELVRIAARPEPLAALRSIVAAEARLALAGR
jgi:hypothetical protein